MYCMHCGAQNSPEATFCQQCGKQLPTTDQDEPTVSTNPPALSPPYEYTPYATTPSPLPDTVFAPPPPPGVPASELPTAPPAQRPKRRRGYLIALALIVLLVLVVVGAYVYLNRSTPEKTLTTYYGALISGDYQTAYDQLSTASKGKITEPAFVQFWQALGGVKAWSTTSLQEQGSTATAALTLTLGNGQTRPATIALVDENGVWKIENETIS
jgi:zinc ribbon protein